MWVKFAIIKKEKVVVTKKQLLQVIMPIYVAAIYVGSEIQKLEKL